jgi:hypothetical protein
MGVSIAAKNHCRSKISVSSVWAEEVLRCQDARKRWIAVVLDHIGHPSRKA